MPVFRATLSVVGHAHVCGISHGHVTAEHVLLADREDFGAVLVTGWSKSKKIGMDIDPYCPKFHIAPELHASNLPDNAGSIGQVKVWPEQDVYSICFFFAQAISGLAVRALAEVTQCGAVLTMLRKRGCGEALAHVISEGLAQCPQQRPTMAQLEAAVEDEQLQLGGLPLAPPAAVPSASSPASLSTCGEADPLGPVRGECAVLAHPSPSARQASADVPMLERAGHACSGCCDVALMQDADAQTSASDDALPPAAASTAVRSVLGVHLSSTDDWGRHSGGTGSVDDAEGVAVRALGTRMVGSVPEGSPAAVSPCNIEVPACTLPLRCSPPPTATCADAVPSRTLLERGGSGKNLHATDKYTAHHSALRTRSDSGETKDNMGWGRWARVAVVAGVLGFVGARILVQHHL